MGRVVHRGLAEGSGFCSRAPGRPTRTSSVSGPLTGRSAVGRRAPGGENGLAPRFAGPADRGRPL